MEYTHPLTVFTEDMKYIVGSGSSETTEGLYQLYVDARFETCYQMVVAVLQMKQHLSANQLYNENDGDFIQGCRTAMEDYQSSVKNIDDKLDFCNWVDRCARSSF